VAILAYALPLINGIEATRQIRLRAPGVEVLIFTMHDNETLVRDLFTAGARGYVLKSDSAHDLVAAVEKVAAHRPYLPGKTAEALLEIILSEARPAKQLLSARERTSCNWSPRGTATKGLPGTQHQRQDGRNAPGCHHSQASSDLDGGVGALRPAQQAD
jgi:DNA-binding NarL/FixJ family response regulator